MEDTFYEAINTKQEKEIIIQKIESKSNLDIASGRKYWIKSLVKYTQTPTFINIENSKHLFTNTNPYKFTNKIFLNLLK